MSRGISERKKCFSYLVSLFRLQRGWPWEESDPSFFGCSLDPVSNPDKLDLANIRGTNNPGWGEGRPKGRLKWHKIVLNHNDAGMGQPSGGPKLTKKQEAEKMWSSNQANGKNKKKQRYYNDDLMWSSPSLDGGKTFPHQLISIPSNETVSPPKTKQEKVTWSWC